MRKWFVLFAALFAVNALGVVAHAQTTFRSNFSAQQENPPTLSTGAGTATTTLNPAGTQVVVNGTFSGLTGNPTAAHIHTGAPRVNGPVICTLTASAGTSGTLTGTCALTGPQVAALKSGQLYLNIHTAVSPGGEIRAQIQRARATVLDYEGDGKTDYVIARNNGTGIDWWTLLSVGSVTVTTFGRTSPAPSDFVAARLIAGDFDGDGKDDVTLWRSGPALGFETGFFILQSSNGTVRFEPFGQASDDPRIVDDYDGDGIDDVAVYRPGASGTWFFRGSLNNPGGAITYVSFGTTGDFPNPGDYDGDGKADFAFQRSSNFIILRSSGGYSSTPFGLASDFVSPGDYDGDGITEPGYSRTISSQTVWFVPLSSTGGTVMGSDGGIAWGPSSGRTRAQGDYDGDGKTDLTVWITNTAVNPTPNFWVRRSSDGGITVQPWGITTDIPVAGYNTR